MHFLPQFFTYIDCLILLIHFCRDFPAIHTQHLSSALSSAYCLFVFNVPQTAKVMIGTWPRIKVSFYRLEKPGIELRTPVYKASGLSTTSVPLLRSLSSAN